MSKNKALTYVRGSDGGFSSAEQEKLIRRYCFKRRYKIVKAFKDENASAKDFNRPDFQEMLEYVRINNAKVDFLIVAHIDRLSRNIRKFISLKKFLEKRGITLLSVSESILKDAARHAKRLV